MSRLVNNTIHLISVDPFTVGVVQQDSPFYFLPFKESEKSTYKEPFLLSFLYYKRYACLCFMQCKNIFDLFRRRRFIFDCVYHVFLHLPSWLTLTIGSLPSHFCIIGKVSGMNQFILDSPIFSIELANCNNAAKPNFSIEKDNE